jgi:hypothetical protein
MALNGLSPLLTTGNDLVHSTAVIVPKGAGTPVLSWAPAFSSIRRDGAGEYTLTLKQKVAYAFGAAIVNQAVLSVPTFCRFDHTPGGDAVKLYFLSEAGAAVDLDLTAAGYVFLTFTVKQNPEGY